MISDFEIIKQLKRLNNVQPNSEYSAISKSIIMSSKDTAFEIAKDNETRKILSPINTINPSPEYIEKSKNTILYQPQVKTILNGFSSIIKQSAYSLSAVTAVIVMAIIFSGVNNFSDENINNEVALEAQNTIKDINIHLEEASYFSVTADKTRLALNEAGSSGPGHANPTIIQKEAREIELYNPRNPEIDSLLEKAAI